MSDPFFVTHCFWYSQLIYFIQWIFTNSTPENIEEFSRKKGTGFLLFFVKRYISKRPRLPIWLLLEVENCANDVPDRSFAKRSTQHLATWFFPWPESATLVLFKLETEIASCMLSWLTIVWRNMWFLQDKYSLHDYSRKLQWMAKSMIIGCACGRMFRVRPIKASSKTWCFPHTLNPPKKVAATHTANLHQGGFFYYRFNFMEVARRIFFLSSGHYRWHCSA